jgi:hypothetical protein
VEREKEAVKVDEEVGSLLPEFAALNEDDPGGVERSW